MKKGQTLKRGLTPFLVGGGSRDRTGDLLHAMQALSQLSYTPTREGALYNALGLHTKPLFRKGLLAPGSDARYGSSFFNWATMRSSTTGLPSSSSVASRD